ncbi:hypothetical protein ACWGBU_40960, partial [Streptomyces vinaceus]
MPDLVVRGTGRDVMAELSGGGEPGSAARLGSRRGRMARRGLVSAAMVVAMVTGGGIASIGEAFAADLPVNITCPQESACEIIADGFYTLQGAAVDDDGNVYVITLNGEVYKVSPGGVKTLITNTLTSSRDLVVAGDGTIYASTDTGTVWKYTPGGVKTQFVTGLGGDTKGISLDADGNIAAVTTTGALWKVTPEGVKTQIAAGLGSTGGVAVSADGNYIVSTINGVLMRVTPSGVKTNITTNLGDTLVGVALDGEGNAYVGNSDGVLWRVSPNGSRDVVATNVGAPTTPLRVFGVACDSNGNLFVSSTSNKSLYRLPGVGVPLNSAPSAPLIAAPKPNAETGAYPVFKGHALAENGSVDADEVQILDANGIILDKVDVRQSDGYFSWKQNGKWDTGPHTLKFVAIRGDLKSDATVLKFTVAPGPVAPVVTKPTD